MQLRLEVLRVFFQRGVQLVAQIVIIFAGTKGYLDDLPVEQCRQFEEELYRFIDNSHRGLWEEIRTKKALDDSLTAKVTDVIKEFKARFVSEHKQVAHA